MKPVNEQEVWVKEKLAKDHRLAVMMMIRQQIDMVGELMERHKDLMESPLSYNYCAGLLEQLQAHAFSTFNDSGATAPKMTDTKSPSYFRFPDEKFGL